jgi:hypothetical protein
MADDPTKKAYDSAQKAYPDIHPDFNLFES